MIRDVEINVAVHANREGGKAVRVSDTGEDARAHWIPRSLITAFHLTGQTTRGFDAEGKAVSLPIAAMALREWKAKELGLI